MHDEITQAPDGTVTNQVAASTRELPYMMGGGAMCEGAITVRKTKIRVLKQDGQVRTRNGKSLQEEILSRTKMKIYLRRVSATSFPGSSPSRGWEREGLGKKLKFPRILYQFAYFF